MPDQQQPPRLDTTITAHDNKKMLLVVVSSFLLLGLVSAAFILVMTMNKNSNQTVSTQAKTSNRSGLIQTTPVPSITQAPSATNDDAELQKELDASDQKLKNIDDSLNSSDSSLNDKQLDLTE